ncbi:right-handed parallel beta-helix repeat-containing protein [Arthrobacter sp. SA17]
MADEAGKEALQDTGTSIKRRGLLRFGTLITAFTGASAISALGTKTAEAAPGDKNPSNTYVPIAEKGVASGVATLDIESKIPSTQIPDLSATYAERVDDRDFATLQAAVDMTPAGGALEIRRIWTIAAPVKVTKAIRISCGRGGAVITSGSGTHGFIVESSDVTFDGVTLVGTGSGIAGTASAIRALGTEAVPIRNLSIHNCVMRDFNKYAIEAVSVRQFTISGNLIEDIAYGAVMILAGVKGYILSNTIKNLVQPTGFLNSYGIAMTRDASKSLELSPRSCDIVCSGNIIDGVTKWEAIDTHGGENLTITNNEVTNAYIGIALVSSATYASKNIIVTNNLLDSGKTDGTARSGIQLVGSTTTVDNVVEYASAVISENIVRNFGTQNTGAQAAIFLQATCGALVSKNRVINGSPNGLNLNNNNQGAMILDNTFIDTWTANTSFTACVYVSGIHQSVTVQGNRAIRADKTAAMINNRGLFVSTSPHLTRCHDPVREQSLQGLRPTDN